MSVADPSLARAPKATVELSAKVRVPPVTQSIAESVSTVRNREGKD